MAHPHLFLTTKDRLRDPKLVIVDEAFWQKGLDEILVIPNDLIAAQKPISSFINETLIGKQSTALLQELRDAGYESYHLWKEARLLKKEFATKDELRPDMALTQQERLLKERSWVNKAPLVLQQLAAELEATSRKESHSVRYELPSNLGYKKAGNLVVTSRKLLQVANNVPIIFIDANAQQEILEQFRDGVEVVEIPVERQAVIHQFTDLTFSKDSFDKRPKQTEKVKAFIKAVGEAGNTLVVCTKSLRHQLTGIDPEIEESTLHIGATFIHFGNFRGLNDYSDFDNVIVVGREEPRSNGLEDLARALWWDADTPLISLEKIKGNKPLQKTKRTYRAAEYKSVQVNVHPDQRAQLVLEQIREAESEQAIDRLRLLRPPKEQQRQVYILSSVPLNVTVTHFYGWNQLQQCLALIEEADGCLPLNPAHMVRRCPLTASSERTARRLCKELETATSLIDILISKVATSKVQYQIKGIKKPSSAIVSTRLSRAEVEAALTACAGVPVTVKWEGGVK